MGYANKGLIHSASLARKTFELLEKLIDESQENCPHELRDRKIVRNSKVMCGRCSKGLNRVPGDCPHGVGPEEPKCSKCVEEAWSRTVGHEW